MTEDKKEAKYSLLYLRLALGTAYLSSVASRFQIWPKGMGGGGWQSFLEYTAEINPWAPASLVPLLGTTATVAEMTFGILLLIGVKLRLTSIASGILLLIFAVSMVNGSGIKSPFDFSVFTASAASFLLAVYGESSISIDTLLTNRRKPV